MAETSVARSRLSGPFGANLLCLYVWHMDELCKKQLTRSRCCFGIVSRGSKEPWTRFQIPHKLGHFWGGHGHLPMHGKCASKVHVVDACIHFCKGWYDKMVMPPFFQITLDT